MFVPGGDWPRSPGDTPDKDTPMPAKTATLPAKKSVSIFDKIYRVPPSAVTIVGLDAPFDGADASHPLYDERTNTVAIMVDVWEHPKHGRIEKDDYITLSDDERAECTGPEKKASRFARSLFDNGVIQPVTVSRVKGGHFLVIDGRQRVKALRRINAIRAKKDLVPHPLPVQIKSWGSDAGQDATEAMVVLNEQRTTDDVVTRAEKMLRLFKVGSSEGSTYNKDRLCGLFGVSKPSLNRYLRFADNAGPNLKKAVRQGVIGWSKAWKMIGTGEGSVLPDECEKIAADAIKAGGLDKLDDTVAAGSKGGNIGKRGRNNGGRASFVKHSQIKKWQTKAPDAFNALPSEMRQAIEWIMNPEGTDLPEDHPLAQWQVAGEKAAEKRGTAGRKKQEAKTVVRKTNKAGEVRFRAMNSKMVDLTVHVKDHDGDEDAAEAAAEAWAAGDADKRPVKKRKAKAKAENPAPKKRKAKAKAEAQAEALAELEADDADEDEDDYSGEEWSDDAEDGEVIDADTLTEMFAEEIDGGLS
jgi:hypothetical protein